MEDLIQVVFKSDNSGHRYLIPIHEEEEFGRLLEESDGSDDVHYDAQDDFIAAFEPYRVEGDLPPLYTPSV